MPRRTRKDATLKEVVGEVRRLGHRITEIASVRGGHRVNTVTKAGRPRTYRTDPPKPPTSGGDRDFLDAA